MTLWIASMQVLCERQGLLTNRSWYRVRPGNLRNDHSSSWARASIRPMVGSFFLRTDSEAEAQNSGLGLVPSSLTVRHSPFYSQISRWHNYILRHSVESTLSNRKEDSCDAIEPLTLSRFKKISTLRRQQSTNRNNNTMVISYTRAYTHTLF